MVNDVIAGTSLLVWVYLICARGGFWTGAEHDEQSYPAPSRWPSVTAVIPARDEAQCIGKSVDSLLRQDYPGRLEIIVVDDDSSDDTAAIATQVQTTAQARHPLTVMTSRGLPAGWAGKLWALKQGIDAAEQADPPEHLLLTDADIVHAPDSLSRLVARAEARGLALTSLMAKLRCESFAERSHVPAFVFFFQMLFPFSWVNRASSPTAAAAGGCMLVRAEALRQAGGIESIRDALIDDCSLAKRLKPRGPIWLGLTQRVCSIRPYSRFADLKRMISRSAYAQLRYSPLLLLGMIAGLAVTFLAGPLCAVLAAGPARYLGLFTWALMALAFQPTLRLYRLSPLWGAALPAITLLYMLYTLDSGYQYARGRGGSWKGRTQANLAADDSGGAVDRA